MKDSIVSCVQEISPSPNLQATTSIPFSLKQLPKQLPKEKKGN